MLLSLLPHEVKHLAEGLVETFLQHIHTQIVFIGVTMSGEKWSTKTLINFNKN